MTDPDPHSESRDPAHFSRRDFLQRSAAIAATASALPTAGLAAVTSAGDHATETYWQGIADQFLLKPGLTYLNTGTRGPSPASVYAAQIESIRQVNEDRLSYVNNVYTADYKSEVRARLSTFLGCKPTELAITNNTTEGMAIGTNGVDFNQGDEIIYTNHDHSGGAQPVNLRCAREGLVPVIVDLSDDKYHPPKSIDAILAAFEAAITPRTRLISFCHINYTDGCVMPVKEICEMARSKNILTLVDGAHPPGMMKMNLADLGCDMYAGACHKWMLAGMLTGFLYVREELLDRVWPSVYSGPVLGKNMYGGVDDREKYLTAVKYETHGSLNYSSLVSIDAALEFHNSIGVEAIEARDRSLAGRAREKLLTMPDVDVFVSENPALCAALVAFKVRGLPAKELSARLWDDHNIYIRDVVHEDIGWEANRLSLHIMASGAEVDRTLAAIEEIARSVVS